MRAYIVTNSGTCASDELAIGLCFGFEADEGVFSLLVAVCFGCGADEEGLPCALDVG